MTLVGRNHSASHIAVREMIWNDSDVRQIYEALRMRGASADDAVAEVARRVAQSDDLPSGENHSPSFDASSLPLNETAGAPALPRWAILGRTVSAVLTLVALLTAGYTLGILGDAEKLYSSLASAALINRANEETRSIDNSAVATKADSVFERELAHNLDRQGFADRTAAQVSKVGHSASGIEATEKAWKVEQHNEQKQSNDDAPELASVRAELADRVDTEAAARKELADSTKRLEANEKEWAAKLNAEREQSKLNAEQERSNAVARDLGASPDRGTTEHSARLEAAPVGQTTGHGLAEHWQGMARDLETVRTEHPKRMAAEASVRPTGDFTLNRKTESRQLASRSEKRPRQKLRGVHWRVHNFNFGLVPHSSVVGGSLATSRAFFRSRAVANE